MTETRDRWDRCQALAAKLKQQSLAQSVPHPQASSQATPSRDETSSNDQ